MGNKWSELRKISEQFAPGDLGIFQEVTRLFRVFATEEACGKCVPCREGGGRILELLERGVFEQEQLDLLEALADTVIATALCGLGKAACREVLFAVLRYQGISEHPGLADDTEKEHPVIHADDCRGCGKCRRGCPVEAISGEIRKAHIIDPAKCVNCEACVSNCPFSAIRPARASKPDAEGVMYVDGIRVPFSGQHSVLAVIRKAGIELPTFCYHSELSVFGACRMCMVQTADGQLQAACALPPKDGLSIRTNTARLLRSRRIILELMLASHCRDCTTCEISGSCTLQKLAVRFGIRAVRFQDKRSPYERDESSPAITLDLNRCVLCGDCVRMCAEVQGVGALQFAKRGSELRLVAGKQEKIAMTDCVGCGQCSAICPTGAIFVKNQIGDAWKALHDPAMRVVVQIAPAVRVSMGEMFGIKPGVNVMNRLVHVWKLMGADAVYDTGFGADLTIMEESEELLERLENGNDLPMFTSCCPSWVKFVENRHPELLPHLSSCRSPMQMFASVIKEHYKKADTADGKKTFHIALMPCTAKKAEAARKEFMCPDGPMVDLVLTTLEFSLMIKESGFNFAQLEEEAPDMPFGLGTGAGVIFGTSGGVAEAVARQLVGSDLAGQRELSYSALRGTEELRRAEINAGGRRVRVAVVHGLGNVEKLLKDMEEGRESFDFVEVMSCHGGCVGGAGQPRARSGGRKMRADGLFSTDRVSLIKQAEHNPVVQRLYMAGLVNRAEELLHVEYKEDNEE